MNTQDGSSAPEGGTTAGSAPASADARRHGRARKRVKVVLLVGLVLVLAVAGSAVALLVYGQESIERTEVAALPRTDRAPVVLPDGDDGEIKNILLIGSDDRDTLDEEQRATTQVVEGGLGRRPDTLMLVQMELNGKGAALLSFPRDLRVELCDGTVDKINASFEAGERSGVGGESCLVETITNHTGIEIHHYAEVDFNGFLRVVELLDGITMHIDEPMIDSKAHLDIPAGCVTLTPDQALGFVRSRAYDDDFGRIARQQRFVREVVDEMTRLGVIANPARLIPLVDAGANAITTDPGLGLTTMRHIATNARSLSAEELKTHTVPGDHAMIDGIAYVVEREEEARVLYASFRDGSVLQPPPPEPAPAPVDVPPVNVLDASAGGGLEAPAAELLTTSDVQVGATGRAEGITLPTSEVLHAPGLEEAAAQVAALLPGAVVRADANVDGLQLVVGDDVDAPALQALVDEAAARKAAQQPLPGATERHFRGADPGDVEC